MKINLGCGPFPIHPQHFDIMGDISEWTLVDKFVQDPKIQNWDATVLDEVEPNSCDTLYSSHLLEHFPHTQTLSILKVWKNKLKTGGELILNVPDLDWACLQILRYGSGQKLDGYYHQWQGEHGLLSVVFGSQSHEGEFHKAGFTKQSLTELLEDAGFVDISITKEFEAHDMGCLIARAKK